MFDPLTVVAMCVESIYRGADPYKPARIGTWAGRVIPKSDGSQTVKIRVNIDYGREQRFAPIVCTIDNVGNVSLKDGREDEH